MFVAFVVRDAASTFSESELNS